MRSGRTSPSPAVGGMFLLALLLTAPLARTDEVHTPGQSGVTRPQKVRDPLPRYPLGAQRDRLSGAVDLAFTVTAEGTVADVEVISSSNPGHGFEESARRAVENWRYAPAMRKGRPVSVRMQVTVEFSPEEKLEQERWRQIEEGLAKLAEAQIYPPGALVAGRDDVSYPAALKQPAPFYPPGARLRQIPSRVVLLVLVSAQGEVVDIPVGRAEQTAYPFREAAEEAVRRWRFKPAMKNGQPVSAYHWVRLDFPPAERAPGSRRRP